MKPEEKLKLIEELKAKYPSDTLYEHTPGIGNMSHDVQRCWAQGTQTDEG